MFGGASEKKKLQILEYVRPVEHIKLLTENAPRPHGYQSAIGACHASMRLRAGWIAAAPLLTVDFSLAPVEAPLGYGEVCSSTVARRSRHFLAATSIVARQVNSTRL